MATDGTGHGPTMARGVSSIADSFPGRCSAFPMTIGTSMRGNGISRMASGVGDTVAASTGVGVSIAAKVKAATAMGVATSTSSNRVL